MLLLEESQSQSEKSHSVNESLESKVVSNKKFILLAKVLFCVDRRSTAIWFKVLMCRVPSSHRNIKKSPEFAFTLVFIENMHKQGMHYIGRKKSDLF